MRLRLLFARTDLKQKATYKYMFLSQPILLDKAFGQTCFVHDNQLFALVRFVCSRAPRAEYNEFEFADQQSQFGRDHLRTAMKEEQMTNISGHW